MPPTFSDSNKTIADVLSEFEEGGVLADYDQNGVSSQARATGGNNQIKMSILSPNRCPLDQQALKVPVSCSDRLSWNCMEPHSKIMELHASSKQALGTVCKLLGSLESWREGLSKLQELYVRS